MEQVESLLTTVELAQKLKRSPETLARWRRMRSGPPYVRMQGRVLYDPGKVAAWIGAQAVHELAA